MTRVELVTPSLPRKCSTTELHRLIAIPPYEKKPERIIASLSGRRGSNPPPIAWKAIALPNELLPQNIIENNYYTYNVWGEEDSNLRRLCQQIYSLPHLTALVSPLAIISKY
jgi:hypothetical protein